MFETRGKTTLITGGLQGIGRAIANEAAKDGNTIVLVQRSSSDTIVAELESLGAKKVFQIQHDLSDPDAIKLLVAQLVTLELSIDILINNAGLLTGGLIETQEPEAICSMLNVNLTALILLTRALLPGMLARKSGKIVNNASVSGKMCIPCASTYAASKAGVVAFTRCIRQELAGTGVSTLLLITPGVKTDMYDEITTRYSQKMDLGFLSAISAEEWAAKVWDAIKCDRPILLPSGSSRVGVWLSQHSPALFEFFIGRYFDRNRNSL